MESPDGERLLPLLTSASTGMCALLSPQEDSLREGPSSQSEPQSFLSSVVVVKAR